MLAKRARQDQRGGLRMRLFPAIALACGLFVLANGDSYAQPQPRPQGPPTDQVLTAVNPQLVANILQQIGYPAEVVNDKDGDYVRTKISNTNVAVGFISCDNKGCPAFVYWTGWTKDPTLNETYANAWNASYLFARAYVDSGGDFIFEMDVSVDGGVTANTIAQSARLFEALLGELFKFQPK
jgi:Putative bacterial sensory transduction regulator